MGKLAAIIGMAFIVAGCGHEETATSAKPAAAAHVAAPVVQAAPAKATAPVSAHGAPRAALDAWLAALNGHDPRQAGALLADDVEYFDAGFSGIQRGREAAVENGVAVFLRGVPDLHWELRGEPIVGADSIAWEWTFSGTNTGTWGGIPATRQHIQLKGVSLLRLRDGKIAQVATYYDTGTLNRQLGL